jgi:hypothetical protein
MPGTGKSEEQLELVPRAGFALERGDTVRFVRSEGGVGAGYFEGWTAGGDALVRVPARSRPLRVPAARLMPSNDERMVRRRGRVFRSESR